MIELKVRKAKGLKEKLLGLIGKDKPEALLIQTRFGIHTFGLCFPIDVVVLDKNHKAVKTKENLKPNSLCFWNPKYEKIVELPKGSICEMNILINEPINLLIS